MTLAEVTTPPDGAAGVPYDARYLLSLARRAAEAAAEVVRDATPGRAALNWREKAVADFVSEVDVAAERRAIALLEKSIPGAAYLAEESTNATDAHALHSGVTFVIDPLDGTTNFLHGFPEYAVSIGVLMHGEPTAAVVLNVPRGETFIAARGAGAWLEGKRLAVSDVYDPARALIGTGFPFKDPSDIPEYLDQMARVMARTAGVRRTGAASVDLASVAAGRLDGFWENRLAPWDVAAGLLLVREAGGACTNLSGVHPARFESDSIVAANPAIHRWLLSTLSGR